MKNIYLPATILCRSPFIFACFFEDFVKQEDAFKQWFDQNRCKYKNIYGLFELGWHYERPERMEIAQKQLAKIHGAIPQLKIIILGNSENETNNFLALDERALFCHQNAFLNEKRYAVTKQKKIYDSIYLARITPFKRHSLATKLSRLLLIGTFSEREKAYAENILSSMQQDTRYIKKVSGLFVYRYLNKAQVGLALSAEEGAMYVAAEYGLCGLPVLTTRNLGGREYSLSQQFIYKLETDTPTPEDVRSGVEHLIAKHDDPYKIREGTIEVLRKYRQRYELLIHQLCKESNEGSEQDIQKALNFPHKLGLRCRLMPWFKYFNTMKVNA